ncbi:MAG TPA: hypothetical protein VLM40_07560 [Gemmata sp.]|nr:hypothetical protein [Gemmata sp.]
MFRRLPILPLAFAATLGLFALTSLVTAQVPGSQPDVKPDNIKPAQDENAKLYKRFAEELLALAQRWEKSDNPEERDRAKSLRAALNLAAEKGVDRLFKELQEGLANPNKTGSDFNNIIGRDVKLRAALDEILKVLETEDDAARLKKEIEDLKKLIEAIKLIKRDQENVRAITEIGKADPNNLAKNQKDITDRTKSVANKGQKNDQANANAGEGKDDRSELKPEMKPGAASPEAKPDTSKAKSSDKPGNDSGMPMESGMGEPKPSPMGDMAAGGDKETPKDGMNASGAPKPGDMKPMTGDPMKATDQQPKSGDSKAKGDGKGNQKPSAGMPGGDGKPMTSKPMDGMPGGGSPSQSKPSPGGGMPSGGGMPPPGGPQQPKDPAQEHIQKAVPPQQEAEQDIRKGENNQASKNQDEAIRQLEQALKELEKRLKQLREKELEKLLANLEERIGRMLRMQEEVLASTINIDKVIQKIPDHKAGNAELQKSQVEADKEHAIIIEADKALKLMEGEGSAVVFAGVLTEVRGDMVAVQNRLASGRVEGRSKANEAEGTQLIEEQIIEQLKLMKEALKKARKDLKDPPKPSDPKDPNAKPPDKKLIDLINELKLIKSLQEQVNKRTLSYSKQDPGEQAKDALVQQELQQLGDRQRVLQEMLHKIATQANQ